MKLILLEDEPLFAQIIARFLDGITDEIIFAKTWEEAEPWLGSQPDVMWIDLHLPGYDAAKSVPRIAEVRRNDADVVILVVSGYIDDKTRRDLMPHVDVIQSKHDLEMTAVKVVSLIVLALMAASERGAKRNVAELLERTCAFMAEASRIAA